MLIMNASPTSNRLAPRVDDTSVLSVSRRRRCVMWFRTDPCVLFCAYECDVI